MNVQYGKGFIVRGCYYPILHFSFLGSVSDGIPISMAGESYWMP